MHATVMWAACLWKCFSDEVWSCVSNYHDIHWQLHDCKEKNENHELTHMHELNICILYDQVAKILKHYHDKVYHDPFLLKYAFVMHEACNHHSEVGIGQVVQPLAILC